MRNLEHQHDISTANEATHATNVTRLPAPRQESFPVVAPAPTDVRATGMQGYCPWEHLGHMREVTLAWHDGGHLGLTDFTTLTISLRRGQTAAQLRSTLAHELAHIERGPGYGPTDSARYRIEERLVDATAVLRLIPAFVLQDLPELVDRHGVEAAVSFLGVDGQHIRDAVELVNRWGGER